MDAQKLVRMANEIAAFFASEPDRAVAIDSVASHLRRFWEPRMRRELLVWLDQHAGEGLSALALDTLKERRSEIAPR